MTNHIINDGDDQTPESKMQDANVVVGDTIEVLTNNQLGYKKYRVTNDNGNKSLTTLADWDMGIFEEPNNENVMTDDENGMTDSEQDGGKRRRRRTRKNRKLRKGKKTKKTKKNRKNERH